MRFLTLLLASSSLCFADYLPLTEELFYNFSNLSQEDLDGLHPDDQEGIARLILSEGDEMDKVAKGPNSADLDRLHKLTHWIWTYGDPKRQLQFIESNPNLETLQVPLGLPLRNKWAKLSTLSISPGQGEIAPYLETFPQISHLELGMIVKWSDPDAFHDALVAHQNLRVLTLMGVSAEAFYELINPKWPLTRISTLRLQSVWIEDDQIDQVLGMIKALPNLEHLELGVALFAAPSTLLDFAKQIARLPKLKSIELEVYDSYETCPVDMMQQILKERS